MDIMGQRQLPAAPGEVWACLVDPQVLAACIPGCQSMQRLEDDVYECTVRASYGPVKATFVTRLSLANVEAPRSYTLQGRGEGGAAGFGEGSADVELVPDGPGTVLKYNARFNAGGRIAQVGARLFSSTTRKLADRFFDAFAQHCAPDAPQDEPR
ncbi:MAG: carbon monoxide dehydrogenase subunit G [Gammaproteobacteria bacterium]